MEKSDRVFCIFGSEWILLSVTEGEHVCVKCPDTGAIHLVGFSLFPHLRPQSENML